MADLNLIDNNNGRTLRPHKNFLLRTNIIAQVTDVSQNGSRLNVIQAKYDIKNLEPFTGNLVVYGYIKDIIGQEIYVTNLADKSKQPFILDERDFKILQGCKKEDYISCKFDLEVAYFITDSYEKSILNLTDVFIYEIKKINPLIALTKPKVKQTIQEQEIEEVFDKDERYGYQLISSTENTISRNARIVYDALNSLHDYEKENYVNRGMALEKVSLNEKEFDEALKELEKNGIIKRLMIYEYSTI